MEFKDTLYAEIIFVDDIKVLFHVTYEYDEEEDCEIYKLHQTSSINGLRMDKTINFVEDVDIDVAWLDVSQQFERVAFNFVEEFKDLLSSVE